MSERTRNCASFWLQRIYNHNPFYVISAALVLYGLQVSFAGRLDPTQGWLLVRLLAGYTLLLAAAGIAIVRWGQVWEDARTLVCLVVVLLVALASSFDRVCLDDSDQAAQYLAAGFAFAIVLCELVIRGLQIRLPWRYRLPFYAQLALLFAYPAWLGRLSINDRETEMAWYVLGLPTFQAAITLLLAPAARQRGRDVDPNGTPWTWPWFPWPAFVLLAVASVLRAVAMSMSFDRAKGFAAGLELYSFVPLALAWIVVCFEGTHGRNRPPRAWAAVLAPLGLLLWALPGAGGSPSQLHYLALLKDAVGSPIQIAACLVAAYYVYLGWRGVRAAEAGLFTALAVIAVVDSDTLSLDRLAPLQLAPSAAALALLTMSAVWRASSLRACAAMVAVLAAATYSGHAPWLTAHHGYGAVHVALAATMVAGLVFRDELGRILAEAAPALLLTAAGAALTVYRFVFPQVETLQHACWTTVLAGLGVAYWFRERRGADLHAAAGCLLASGALALEHIARDGFANLTLRGKEWLAWGLACFTLGLAISLIKGGQWRRLWEWLKSWDAAPNPPEGVKREEPFHELRNSLVGWRS